ncbi:membrane protein insertion efficiency factor YidD [Dactylosporangium sp. NPDC049525]|uniref:membrane protein insertion efficiency factor YidD n=1 Tax=Dactylosporangium sp. NPDC049525 TaxID=3154730 RepID=UPI00342C382E
MSAAPTARRASITTVTVGLLVRLGALDARSAAVPTPLPPPRRARGWFLNPLAWAAVGSIAAYRRFLSPRQPRSCRFTPSCSQYMSMSIRRYGLLRGVRRGAHRLRRCIGFVPAGVDWP